MGSLNSNSQQKQESEDCSNSFFDNASVSKIDLSQAYQSVDSAGIAPTGIVPQKPEYVDLVRDKEDDEEDENEVIGDDEEWIVSIKKFLNDINRKIPRLQLSEIVERLESFRYCSEFDVLNDILNDINNSDHAKQVKSRFVHYFGNLSQWSFKRLIKWCQCNNLYQICQKIRRNKIDGKQFINRFSDMGSVRQYFDELTSIQVVSLFHRIN